MDKWERHRILSDRSAKVQRLGSIYFINGLRVEGVDYDNGKWHWSDRIGAWYTHSLPEAIRSGYVEVS
jgi:hypothetical protein